MGVATDLDAALALDSYTAAIVAAGHKLILVSSNTNEATTLTMSSITEATFTGYAAVTLSGYSAASVASHVATSSPNPATFTLTAGTQSIYGFARVNSAKTVLYTYQRFAGAPLVLVSGGLNQVVVTATEGDKDQST